MKQFLYFGLLAVALCGCSKEKDLFTPKEVMTDDQRVSYAELMLGISIDKNQNWVLTEKYQVVVTADAQLDDISKVCILSDDPFLSSAHVLASVPATSGKDVRLEFRTPLADKLLHAACINNKGDIQTVAFVAGTDSVRFVKQPTVTVSDSRSLRRSQRVDEVVTVNDDLLYIPWNRPDYPELQQEALLFVPKQFPEGQTSNLPQVAALNNHSLQTDWVGGQVTMTFLGGRANNTTTHIGYHIYPIDDPSNVQTYIIDDRFNAGSDDPLENYMVDETKNPTNYSGQKVALVWRDHTGNLKNALPPDMQVDFFVVVDGKNLSNDPLRVTVYSVNGRTYLSCEDGSDNSFNDKMFYIEEGINIATEAPEVTSHPVQSQVWTYAWEDKDRGDYDMNDCVIRVEENPVDPSKLMVTLLAVGAHRDLQLCFAADNSDVFGYELHDVLGAQRSTLVNTSQQDAAPVTVSCVKPAGFDFQTNAFVLVVKYPADEAEDYGKETYTVSLPTTGQDPHAVAIPGNWAWPKEKVSIISAYPKFREWAQDVTNQDAFDWYLHPAEGKTIRIE